ncbi:hypothetical protein G9F71_025685 [Clostridium sp. FP2]|uniref:hypothetical protein n=1 Tax=Clostridium sp. FP2 TaxID=2724481 RepID=UPI001CCA13CC|nr:hypothetical protein [Clostridium sp. FP2]MBZ9626200.1 hypothetical protein [Clostridium sp. FP2]
MKEIILCDDERIHKIKGSLQYINQICSYKYILNCKLFNFLTSYEFKFFNKLFCA